MVTDHFQCRVLATTRFPDPHEETTVFSIGYLFLVKTPLSILSCLASFLCEIVIEKVTFVSFHFSNLPSDL